MKISNPPFKLEKYVTGETGIRFIHTRQFTLTLPEDTEADLPATTQKITIYPSFVSDGASVPRFFWRILSPALDPVTLTPSIIHDYLYYSHTCTRYQADKWYMQALIIRSYPRWKAYLTYIALRLFGKSHWD